MSPTTFAVTKGTETQLLSMAFCTHQIGKGQDEAGAGKVGAIEYIYAADGHGGDAAIESFRATNKDEMATMLMPMHYLHDRIRSLDTYQSGFALVFARTWSDEEFSYLDVWWVGDAKARVFLDGKVYFTTDSHNHDNEDEVSRIAPRVAAVKKKMVPLPTSPGIIEHVPLTMTAFNQNDGRDPYFLSMTQAFGHNGVTGFYPSHQNFLFRKGSSFRVVCGSDGFYDMPVDGLASKSATELATEAVAMWQSDKWGFLEGKKRRPTNWGGTYDDVCVAVM